MFLQYKSFENTIGKGQIAHNERFLLFPVFSTHLENSTIFIKFELVICKLFQFGNVKNLSFGNGLTLSQTANFRLFQTKRVLQTTISNVMKMAESFQTGRKYYGKRRNCLSKAISPLPVVSQKTCASDQGLFGKGLILRNVSYRVIGPFKTKFPLQLE